jgi:tetratricopeptide (TPR) repeat protein/transcriptional regulator with XRE-family HTH domain
MSAVLTQSELAYRAGIGVRTVSNLERGVNTSPHPNTVRLLADALGLADEARAELAAAARGTSGSGSHRSWPTGGYLGAVPAARLVAREAERTAIVEALAAATGGRGGVLLLAGEPGIGKTRLAQDASVQAEERGFLVATGRCYRPQSGTPFAPLFEAFARLYAGAPAPARAGIAERWPSLATLLPDELAPGPTPARAAADEAQRLYRAATGFVREIAAVHPVALLVDDLHWADGGSLELFAYLARHTGADRLLMLGTYRTAEVGSSHPLRELIFSLSREGLATTIAVDRLDRDATTRLLADRLDGTPVSEEFGALIHRHTRGNPFFTVEMLLALIERGDVFRLDGRWIRREVTELEAPASVTEAIGERVGRLSLPAQHVLETVSILGEVFDVEDLSIVDADERELEDALEEAVGSGLLTTVEGRYAFDHVLTQQALYAALSPTRRRRLHRRAGDQLERRSEAVRRRRAIEIALHLEAGGAADRAAPHVLVAGDAAAAIHAHREALEHYRHGLELGEQLEDEATIANALERLGQVHLVTAAFDEAVEHLIRASDAWRRAGDRGARLRVEGIIAHALHRQGAGGAAAERLAEVVAELDPPLDPDDQTPGLAALSRGLALVRLALREHELSLEAAEQACRLAHREGAVGAEADAQAVRGTVLLFLDRPDEAVAALEAAIALAEGGGATTGYSDAILALSWARTMHGDLERALALAARGVEITQRSGNTDAEALHRADLGLTRFYRGEWVEAQAELERSVELAHASAPTLFSGIPPAYLGLLRRGQGDVDAAAACYADAATAADLQTFAFDAYVAARLAELDLIRGEPDAALGRLERWLAEESPTRLHDVMLLGIAAEACLDLGHIARGEALADQALRRARATHNEIDGIDAARIKGRSLLLQGRHADARSRLEAALSRAEAVPYPWAGARVQLVLARLSEAQGGDRRAARERLSAASETFARLGAAGDAAAAADAVHAVDRADG